MGQRHRRKTGDQTLLPKRITISHVEYWRVRLGQKFTGGKAVSKVFRHKADADAFIEQSIAARRREGAMAFTLNERQRLQASEAFQLLKDHSVSLPDVVRDWIARSRPAVAKKSFSEVAEEFVVSRKARNARTRTLVMYESHFRVISRVFGGRDITTLGRAELEAWLGQQGWSPRTRRNYLVTLRTLFGFAIGHEYLTQNPVQYIEAPILEDSVPKILTPAEAKELMDRVSSKMPEMLPAVALSLFAGLRRSEVCAIDWSEVDCEAGLIEVTAGKAKTRQRRVVTMSPNLKFWVERLARRSGNVAPTRSPDVFGQKLNLLIRTPVALSNTGHQSTTITEWRRNALRHSFGSYHLALNKNEALTATEMGNSPAVVFRHYRAVVKETDARLFWSISPR